MRANKFSHLFSLLLQRLSALSLAPKTLHKQFLALSVWRKVLLAYPVCVMCGGVWQNPFFALIVGSFYWIGIAGFVMFITAHRHPGKQWQYAALGLTGIFVMVLWLEILRLTFPVYV
jgi:hypothetical protein